MKVRVIGEIGTIVVLNGQEYRLIRFDRYTTKIGRTTALAVWQTTCAECGAEFEAIQEIGKIELSRRCAQHKKPGVPVTSRSNNSSHAEAL
jgi:hypothetical protein